MIGRHRTGNAEVITILNRYGHGESYSRTIELVTAMCYSVTSSESVLQRNLSRDNNAVLHLCYDRFDLGFPTMWCVRPAKAQTSLRIRAV